MIHCVIATSQAAGARIHFSACVGQDWASLNTNLPVRNEVELWGHINNAGFIIPQDMVLTLISPFQRCAQKYITRNEIAIFSECLLYLSVL